MHDTDKIHRHLARALQALTGEKYARCLQRVRDTANPDAVKHINEAVAHIKANPSTAPDARPGAPGLLRDTHPLPSPDTGRPAGTWAVGIAADGTELTDVFAPEVPHLFITGSQASGKTNTLRAMLDQVLTVPNGPVATIIDPTGGLAGYADHPNVDNRITQVGAAGDDTALLLAAAEVLDHLHDTVRRDPGQQRLLVITECADLYLRPREEWAVAPWQRAMDRITELGKAGVHIVIVTNWAKPEAIPVGLLTDSRRIGFRTNRNASRLATGTDALVRHTIPGHGLYLPTDSSEPIEFRGYLRTDG